MSPPLAVVRPSELSLWLADRETEPLVAVDLDAGTFDRPPELPPGIVALGLTQRRVERSLELDALTCTLSGAPGRVPTPAAVTVPDPVTTAESIARRVAAAPSATAALADVLSGAHDRDARAGLVVESLAYSMLLAGPEFAAWRHGRDVRHDAVPAPSETTVRLVRTARELEIRLERAGRRNAFDVRMRDGLLEGLALAAADDTVERVVLTGAGPDFCSGGDLDEFGTTSDPAAAHRIRLATSVGLRLTALAERVEARLHGHCLGAGIELPAFAARITVADDTAIALPELDMGLIPGAGGTVSVTRRIGRWRTAYLVLSGATLDAGLALEWGLADARA